MAQDKENSEIDLKKILLPKKEGVAPAPTQRINAGVLLEQEQKATLKTEPQPQEKSLVEPAGRPEDFSKGVAVEGSSVRPLETYRGDIEQIIQKKNVSVVSIAAAEAQRRAFAGQAQKPEAPAQQGESHELGLRIAAVVGGVVLIAAAAGLLAFIFLQPQANAPVQNNLPAPFISVDQTQVIQIPQQEWRRESVVAATLDARGKTALSLGLIARLYLTQATTTEFPPSIAAQTLLATLAPEVPAELLGALSGEHLLGVHSFDGNQAFLLLDVEHYEGAYAGILAWEWSMEVDLAPLFTRTPRPRIPEEGIAPSTSSGQATTTATTPQQFLQTKFIDRIVENRDARVIQNSFGDILLLWTFLDRNTLLITTNEYTLREVVSRLNRPPVIPLP